MSDSDAIDTSGQLPEINAGVLASLLTGTVLYGWYAGFLGFLDSLGSGITGGMRDVGVWLSDDLIVAVFAIAENATLEVARQNAEFVSMFGAFAIVVSVVEAMLITAVIGWALRLTLRRIREVFKA